MHQLTHGFSRGLGTHLSFVRSVMMDRWTEKQIAMMMAGGNEKMNDYLRDNGIKVDEASTKEKYDNPVAELYRQKLAARAEGREEPTELPQPTSKSEKEKVPKKMEGFGSAPPPPVEEKSHTVRNVAIAATLAVVGVGSWLLTQHV